MVYLVRQIGQPSPLTRFRWLIDDGDKGGWVVAINLFNLVDFEATNSNRLHHHAPIAKVIGRLYAEFCPNTLKSHVSKLSDKVSNLKRDVPGLGSGQIHAKLTATISHASTQ